MVEEVIRYNVVGNQIIKKQGEILIRHQHRKPRLPPEGNMTIRKVKAIIQTF